MENTRIDNRAMPEWIAQMAQRFAHLKTMKWVHNAGGIRSFAPPTYSNCTSEHIIDVLTWLHEHQVGQFSLFPLTRAVQLGVLSVIQWYHAHRPEDFNVGIMDTAAQYGHLHILEWLHENRSEGCTHEAMESAAFAGHLPIVQWLHAHCIKGRTNIAMTKALLGGQLEVLMWLSKNDDACPPCAIQYAFHYLHILVGDTPLLHALQWLETQTFRADGWTGTCCTTYELQPSRGIPFQALNVGDVQLLTYLAEHHNDCIALVVFTIKYSTWYR